MTNPNNPQGAWEKDAPTAKTPLADLKRQAIEHYLKLSDEACHFNSFVVKAIESYAEPGAWKKTPTIMGNYWLRTAGAWPFTRSYIPPEVRTGIMVEVAGSGFFYFPGDEKAYRVTDIPDAEWQGPLHPRADVPDWAKEEYATITVPKSCIPAGGELIEAYETEKEIIVLGNPPDEPEGLTDEQMSDWYESAHNCDEMGCGTLSHVMYRFSKLPTPCPQVVEGLREALHNCLTFLVDLQQRGIEWPDSGKDVETLIEGARKALGKD